MLPGHILPRQLACPAGRALPSLQLASRQARPSVCDRARAPAQAAARPNPPHSQHGPGPGPTSNTQPPPDPGPDYRTVPPPNTYTPSSATAAITSNRPATAQPASARPGSRRRRHRADPDANDRTDTTSAYLPPMLRPTALFGTRIAQLRRSGAPMLTAHRAADLLPSLAVLPLVLKVSLPPAANVDAVRLELMEMMHREIGEFNESGTHSAVDDTLIVKFSVAATHRDVSRVDALLQQRNFAFPSPSVNAELPVTATQCQPTGGGLPFHMTLLVIHHMASADTIAGATRALLLASGYADSEFKVVAEMLGGSRGPAHHQIAHGNSTVIRAFVDMKDPEQGLCPKVRDIHRGDHIGPITISATFSGERDIPLPPSRYLQLHSRTTGRTTPAARPTPPRSQPLPPDPAPLGAQHGTGAAPDGSTSARGLANSGDVNSDDDHSMPTAADCPAPADAGVHPMPTEARPMSDTCGSPRSTGDSSEAGTAPPPTRRQRTDDRMDLGDADVSSPSAPPAPESTPMLDGSDRAEHQAAAYTTVHGDVEAPTSASTRGRPDARPTGLGYTGATTRSRSRGRVHRRRRSSCSTPRDSEPAPAGTPALSSAPTAAGGVQASEPAPDPTPEGFVEQLAELASISSAAAAAALEELRLTEPVLWHTWTSCGNDPAIPGALRPSLDRIIRGDDTSDHQHVPHSAVDVSAASMPDSHLLVAGYTALQLDVLSVDELSDPAADHHADHILNDWAATLPDADRSRHRDRDAPLTAAAMDALMAAANRWRCQWANSGPDETAHADILSINREPGPPPTSPPSLPSEPEQLWTTVARRQSPRAAALAAGPPTARRLLPSRSQGQHSQPARLPPAPIHQPTIGGAPPPSTTRSGGHSHSPAPFCPPPSTTRSGRHSHSPAPFWLGTSLASWANSRTSAATTPATQSGRGAAGRRGGAP